MQTPNVTALENAIRSQELIEINQFLFAKINSAPKILERGEQTLGADTLYVHLDNPKPRWNETIRGQTYIGAEPFPRDAKLYDGRDKAKFFPEIAQAIEETDFRIQCDLQTTISVTTSYCCKTGQPLGPIDTNSLYQAIAIHGREKLKDFLYQSNLLTIHPAWVDTSGEALDRLCEHDPRAFIVYTLGLLTKPPKTKLQKPEIEANFHWAMARAYQYLSLVNRTQLIELADALSHLAMYAPRSMEYLERSLGTRVKMPDALAQAACAPSFLSTIDKAINATIQWRENFDAAMRRKLVNTNLRELAIAEMMKGPSNIRATKSARRHSTNDTIKKKRMMAWKEADDLATQFKALLSGSPIPGNEAWRDRVQTRISPQTTEEANEMLAAFNSMSFDDSDDDANANTVEVNKISWAELAKREEEADAEKLMASRPSISIRDRLKAASLTAQPEPHAQSLAKPIPPQPQSKLPAHLAARLMQKKGS